MRKVALAFSRLTIFLLLSGGVIGFLGTGALDAREFKKKTFEREGSKITVKYMGTVDVLMVEPFLKPRRGKDTLRYKVVIKNTGTKTERFHVSAEGKAEDGIWLYGGIGRPTTVKAGQEKTVRISTRHQRKTIPKEIRVQVLQSYGKRTKKKKK